MRDWPVIYLNLLGILMVFIVIVTLIYLANPTLDLFNYILFAINTLLMIITLIFGTSKGFVIGLLAYLCYGGYLIYAVKSGNSNNNYNLQSFSWFLLFPISIYLSGHISLLFNRLNETIKVEQLGFDGETGLYNLKAFYLKGKEEIARMVLTDNQLFLAIIKIKYYRELKSIYGSDARNQVLLELRNKLIKYTREYECKARVSRDCFTIIIPSKDESIEEIKKRIYESMKKNQIMLKRVDKYITVETQIGVGEYVTGEDILQFKERVENELQFDVT